jgi:MFS family permease
MFDDEERPRVTGVMAMVAGVMQALAPLLGGVLLSNFWWGSIYLVVVPMTAVVFVAGWWLVPASELRRGDKPDVVGAVLSIAAVTMLIWVVINAPALGWLARGPAVALGLGLALLVAFLCWERVTANPMMELSLFRRRRFTGALLGGLVPAFSVTGALFLVTQHLQFELGLTPWQVGLAMVPFAVAMLLAAGLVSARLARVLGIGRTIAGGLAVSAIVLCCFGFVSPSAELPAVLVILVLVGFNVGICAPLTNAALIASLPKDRTGIGTGVSSTTQQLGNALGVAALGVIFSLKFAADLPREIPPEAAASLPTALAATEEAPRGEALVPRVHEAFASGFSASLLAAGLLMAVGACAVAVLLRRDGTEGS